MDYFVIWCVYCMCELVVAVWSYLCILHDLVYEPVVAEWSYL